MGVVGWAATAILVAGAGAPQQDPGSDRIYGRVVSAAGEVYQGFIRWDRNEGSWADILNGNKEMPWENVREAETLEGREKEGRQQRSVRILGLRISWSDESEDLSTSSSSGIRFGHVRSLSVIGDNRAMLTLRSGERVELDGSSTDLGDELRELIVEDPARGDVTLRWRDLDQVEFMPAPAGAAAPTAARLYGTLRTRRGQEFTGWVAWDVDEIYSTDVLNGEEEGRDREILFGDIAAIERSGSGGARVILKDGEELAMTGSNDVDSSNRGIAISDLSLGQVQVPWRSFEQLVFQAAPSDDRSYATFDGGHRLYGTVETENGERHTGQVRWDNDEENSWEILDGDDGEAELDVELGQVHSIRRTMGGADVTLRDGRTISMDGSNDVDSGNKGIFVTGEGAETVLVRWRDFREVTFEVR